MPFAITLHILSAALWVGGMFFAYMALRPAAAQLLDPPQRLPLWVATFKRFFPWVWLFVALLPATGYWMIFAFLGGMGSAGLHVHLMQGLGWVMILLYMHLYFAPFRRLKDAVVIADWPAASKRLNQIRFIIGTNLLLGILVIAIGAGGRYW
jgi:uncharacterized membrane protein